MRNAQCDVRRDACIVRCAYYDDDDDDDDTDVVYARYTMRDVRYTMCCMREAIQPIDIDMSMWFKLHP